MKTSAVEFPLRINISFRKLFESYRARLDSEDEQVRNRAEEVLAVADKYPILSEGLQTEAQIKKHKKQIDFVTNDLFPAVLETNEIKKATIPFQEFTFRSSKRYQNIVKAAGDHDQFKILDFDDDNVFIMGCSVILNVYYGYKADFKRPFYYKIPDAKGINRSYKVLYNADFIEVEKTDKAIDITEEDYLELLENFDNVALWKEKFPPNSWISHGFIIANMYDSTVDSSLSSFKASLLTKNPKDEDFVNDFQNVVQSVFNLPELCVGYTLFNSEENTFERAPHMAVVPSYILNGKDKENCMDALCEISYGTLFLDHKFYCVADVAHYHNLYPDNVLYKKLHDQNVGSAIIASLVSNKEILGILEIVSPHKYDLNTINANKLLDIMPYLVDSVRRNKQQFEDEKELLIQEECTSIHNSVHWKFKKEAERVLQARALGDEDVVFKEIVFQNVYPLFGQIDIKGSSVARNDATQKDLLLQLDHVNKIITRIFKIDELPIYEQLNFRIKEFESALKEQLKVSSERRVLNFIHSEIIPLFNHLREKSEPLRKLIEEYEEMIEPETGLVYKYRKEYDDSVMIINKKLVAKLDKEQIAAQKMYPHYFERFKTDGIEHNLYIGESITKDNSFNKVYLYNLRLWQLQVMCEMENSYYKLKANLPMQLDVASMILVFNTSLSLRFRMDEKRFDVDGTYNARYEVVKKRVDKANIKGTDERITQPGKITIVYSQKQDEKEYLKYIGFLQSKHLLDEDVEIFKLQELQGVTGLSAIRVSVLYTRKEDEKEEYYTYDDLMKEIKS